MKNIYLRISFLLISSLSLFNCATKKEIGSDGHINNQDFCLNGVWELNSISNVQNLSKQFPEKLPTLIFENKEGLIAFGNDGCNQYKAEVVRKKTNQIEIKNEMAVSRMFCDNVNSNLYLENLAKIKSFECSENILQMFTETDTLKFYKVSLNGKWVLDKLNTVKGKVSDLYPYKKPFLNIDINSNQVTGNTACNSITAHFLIFENKMTFNHIAMTKMFCEGENEKDFTNALSRITNYELKGTRLILFEKDKIIMEIKREYE